MQVTDCMEPNNRSKGKPDSALFINRSRDVSDYTGIEIQNISILVFGGKANEI